MYRYIVQVEMSTITAKKKKKSLKRKCRKKYSVSKLTHSHTSKLWQNHDTKKLWGRTVSSNYRLG